MKKRIIEEPKVKGGIPDAVNEMLNADGMYIGSMPGDKSGRFVPIVVIKGVAYSMVVHESLNPTRFIPGTQIDGPFKPLP